MNKFVKVLDHPNWFLLLDSEHPEPEFFSAAMQEKILRSEVCALHNPNVAPGFEHQIIMAATKSLDYAALAEKFGAILIRPIGSYMPLNGNKITEEILCEDFPIEEFGEIVICENDRKSEQKWREYLKNRFPNKTIVTINYFDLRSDNEVKTYFEKAKYVTFSTTFSNMEWFKKLNRHIKFNHQIIGYSHDESKWKDALKINSKIEIIKEI